MGKIGQKMRFSASDGRGIGGLLVSYIHICLPQAFSDCFWPLPRRPSVPRPEGAPAAAARFDGLWPLLMRLIHSDGGPRQFRELLSGHPRMDGWHARRHFVPFSPAEDAPPPIGTNYI